MHFAMHIVVTNGIAKNEMTIRIKQMTDEQMMEVLNRMDDLFGDFIAEDLDPVMIASVVFAVAIKQLKIHLTDENFVAIIDEIRSTDINELIVDVQEEVKKKRTIH